MDSVIAWLSPILSTIIVTAATASINAHIKRRDHVADERHAETEAKRKKEEEWRTTLDAKVDAITDATQTTMRTTILHYCEKYITRGWVTPEERASLYDMHKKYAALNANGFIEGYVERVMALPDKEI